MNKMYSGREILAIIIAMSIVLGVLLFTVGRVINKFVGG